MKLGISPSYSVNSVTGWLMLDGTRVAGLRYVNGNFEMSGAVRQVLRDSLLLDDDEFTSLHECPLSQTEYLKLLRVRVG